MDERFAPGTTWAKRLRRLIDLIDTPNRYGQPGEVLMLGESGRKLVWIMPDQLGSLAAHIANADAHHNHVTIGTGGLSAKLAISAGQVLTLGAFNHTDLSNVTADQHHIGFIGLEDNAETTVSPGVDDYIQLKTGNSILGIVAGTGFVTFTVNEGNIDHGAIGNVTADQHHTGFIGLEDHTYTAVTPAEDDRIRLKTGNTILGIVAGTNLVTFTVNQGNIDHGAIAGLGDNDHNQYPLKAGAETITGVWQWGTDLLPIATDAYDIGSASKLWRKGWLSELDSILFVENSIQVTGGWWMVPHASGTFPYAITVIQTFIDFGQAMTLDDFVLIRGSGQVEYMQIDYLDSGTIYHVVRDLDGSGANTWYPGQVFVVLGNVGDGRIEFDAMTAGPRVSAFEQGATYNAQNERVRIGDLTGWESAGLTGYGWAAGDYSDGKYAYYDPTAGLVVSGTITATGGSFSGVLSIGANGGIYQGTGTFASPTTGLKFWNDSGLGRIGGYNAGVFQVGFGTDGKFHAGADAVLLDNDGMWLDAGSYKRNQIVWVSGGENIGATYTSWAGGGGDYVETVLRGWDLVGGCGTRITIAAMKGYPTPSQDNRWCIWSEGFCSTSGDIRLTGGISVGSESLNPAPGELLVIGNYKRVAGESTYTGGIYVPCALYAVMTGDAKAIGSYTITMSSVPVGTIAVYVRLSAVWTAGAPSSSTHISLRKYGDSSTIDVLVRYAVTGVYGDGHGLVQLDSSKRTTLTVGGANCAGVYISVMGYVL